MKTKALSLIAMTMLFPSIGQAAEGKALPSSQPQSVTSETRKGFFLSADYIFWKPYVDDLEYAVSGLKSGVAFPQAVSTAPVTPGKIFEPDFKPSSGFKVGAGYTLGGHKEWDIFLNYTWLKSSADSSVSAKGDFTQSFSSSGLDRLYGIWNHPGLEANTAGTESLVSGSGDWSLFFQTLDLEIGRLMQLRKRFSLRPHVGFKGAWIDQKYDVSYVIANSITAPGQTVVALKIPMKNDFHGIGVRAGFDAAWHFSKHFSLFGNLGASLIWGDFSIHSKTIETSRVVADVVSTPRGVTINISSRFYDIVPELDATLGLHAERGLYDNRFLLEANLMWEQQVWFNQNQLFYFMDIAALGNGMRQKGNLSLQGLTANLKFHF